MIEVISIGSDNVVRLDALTNASSGAFIMVLNAGLAATFGALVASGRDAAVPVVTAAAVVCAAVCLATSVLLGMRQFKRIREHYVPLFASVQQ